ncbi:hypothetical protein PoB_006787700 [Plakobranchus ocellatus]|uniref:Uncharacterized protein n=1 Tax=Plakobranchus ocellatus TaxID=259542 RepID=A0AAV4DAT1_9GAST|nr:hypothetical protein PoB_006787700 [Plakobranchus ocellatus]
MSMRMLEEYKCMEMEIDRENQNQSDVLMDSCERTVKEECSCIDLEEEHEDACTQTDGHTLCKSVPDVEGPDMEVPYEIQDEDSLVFPSSSLHLKLSSPTIDSTTDPATNDSLSSIGPCETEKCCPEEENMEHQDAIVPSFSSILHDHHGELGGDQNNKWCSPSGKTIIHGSG